VISKNTSDVKIHWGDQRLPVRVEESSEEADLALLSVELADHPYLPLSEDLVSFEVLHVHGYKTLTHVSNQLDNVDLVREQNCQAESPTFDECLTVKGFAGDLEKIMLEIGGGNIIKGMSGTPLFNPRTNGVCGLISGECEDLKAVTATNIKNALKFSQLANIQGNIPRQSSNLVKVFIIYAPDDEASLNELIQSLHDIKHANLALYWEDYNKEGFRCCPATFDSAQIILLLVRSNPCASDDYYKIYVSQARERCKLGENRVIQVLPSNVSPVVDWPQQSIERGEIAKGIREIIEDLNIR
jgi:hypothetical protein